MDAQKQKRSTEFVLRWSPLFLLGALIPSLLSFWFAPFSPSYLCGIAVLGLTFTILTLICWRLESRAPLNWLVAIPTIFLMSQGQPSVVAWAFPDSGSKDLGAWIDVQYFFLIFLIFFAVLLAFRATIRTFLFGKDGTGEPLVKS